MTLDHTWSMENSLISTSDSVLQVVPSIPLILYFDLQTDAK